ncbi:hypothetical protein Q4561_15320 [Alteromonas sp. 1_MG-2023]|uniref:hypothetical protein n=1 Tax=Alteromonas sp. 1_MG-2023 TaxID=3062669 RepID=UPI0026E37E20|nr:hypothetical protein [Alteromonas sp. 1_MG-2023]MDO6568440.1 hypothetical protein [Alteromonas sp. 1_MG-2023]
MRTLMLLTANQYGVVSHFFEGIYFTLAKKGYDIDCIDCSTPETIKESLGSISSVEDYDNIFSFNGVGLGPISSNFNTLEFAKTKPVYVYCVDNPIHIITRFYGHPVVILCVAKEHAELMRQFGHKAEYFPHAVSSDTELYKITLHQEKTKEIIFPVSFMESQALKPNLKAVWGQVGHIIDGSNSVTDFLINIGVLATSQSPSKVVFDENIRRVSVLVDKYIRAKQRESCLLAFADKGIELTVIGRHSDKFKAITPFHRYEEKVTFPELLSRISKSSYVLHQSPGFEYGLHERLVYPLICGTPVLTWNTPFINSTFKHAGIVKFGDSLPMKETVDYANLVEAGRRFVNENHTWTNRLTSLFENVEKHTNT